MTDEFIENFADGRYQVISKIGDGITGSVYLARDEGIDELVAIKYAGAKTAANPDLLKRFDQEIQLLTKLNHRNLVKHISHGYQSGRPFLVMEFIEGLPFNFWRNENLNAVKIAEVLIQLLEGLKYLHSQGIVHRDLKPENLMIISSPLGEHLKIIDFGFARLLEHEERITMTGEIIGSPAYIAPEQVRGSNIIDNRADIFTFGIITFEAFCGKLPFVGKNPSETVYAIFSESPRNFKKFLPDAPEELVEIISKCLKKQPYQRPGNSDDIICEFQAMLSKLRKLNLPEPD